ncbi:unnamed protein product [Withania somnifera]
MRSCKFVPSQQPSQSRPVSQPSTQYSSSLCPETSRVKGSRKQAASSSTTKATSSLVGRKRTRDVGFDIYTDTQTGRQVINIPSGTTLKDVSLTNIDLGFKPPGLKWKGKKCYY